MVLHETLDPVAPATVDVDTAARPLGRRAAADADRKLMAALVAEQLVTSQAATALLQRRDAGEPQPLSQLLVAEEFASQEDLLVALVDRSGLPYVPLAQYPVREEAVRLLPASFCIAEGVLPYDRIGRAVLVAIANPFDHAARREVERRLQCRVFWSVSVPAEITALVERAQRTGALPRKL